MNVDLFGEEIKEFKPYKTYEYLASKKPNKVISSQMRLHDLPKGKEYSLEELTLEIKKHPSLIITAKEAFEFGTSRNWRTKHGEDFYIAELLLSVANSYKCNWLRRRTQNFSDR